MKVPNYVSEKFIGLVLEEDIGRGDLTTELTPGSGVEGVGIVKAKEALVLCGVDLAAYVFQKIDPALKVEIKNSDGSFLKKGEVILEVRGASGSILTAERTVLNFLQRLSGVSTLTMDYVAQIRERPLRAGERLKSMLSGSEVHRITGSDLMTE